MGSLWSLVTILGPIVLIGVVIYAYVRNKRAPDANFEKAERGARELREEIHEDHHPEHGHEHCEETRP